MTETTSSLTDRMIGASLLNVHTFEEVEHDQAATLQAAGVVAMVAVAQGIGASGAGLIGALTGSVAAIIGWLVWAGITYVVGDKLFGGEATWGEVLRTLGFAQAPGVLFVFGVLPLTGLLLWVIPLWMAVAGFIGLRQALDIGNAKTFFTVLIGAVAYGVLTAIF